MSSSNVIKGETNENSIENSTSMGQPMGCVSPNTLSCIDILMVGEAGEIDCLGNEKSEGIINKENKQKSTCSDREH